MDLAVLLAHVDLELAGGAAALPAVVAVAATKVALGEPAGDEGGFEERAGEPEGEHAEEDGENALLEEGVGEELPELAVGDGAGLQHEMADEELGQVRSEPAEEEDGEEGRDVR